MVDIKLSTNSSNCWSQSNGPPSKPGCQDSMLPRGQGSVPFASNSISGQILHSTLSKVLLLVACCTVVLAAASLYTSVNNAASIKVLERYRSASPSSGRVRELQRRVQMLEVTLVRVVEEMMQGELLTKEAEVEEDDFEDLLLENEEELALDEEGDAQTGPSAPDGRNETALRAPRARRSPETLRRPSRYMKRPVPVYNKAYGLDLKESEGLQLYSSLQGPSEEGSSLQGPSEDGSTPGANPDYNEVQDSSPRRRQRPPASFLKSGTGLRRRSQPTKDTPGDDDWDAAVSKVQQGGTAAPTAPVALVHPAPVIVQQRPRKRPHKKNSLRRRRGARTTAAHFNGMPAAAGGAVWRAAPWLEGLGLLGRYKTEGDHVTVADAGVYLLYAQVKFAYGKASGFDLKINGQPEASCSLPSVDEPATCYTSIVTYLPKNSVVRVESTDPYTPALRLGDGEGAALGLVRLLDAPDTPHQLYG